MAINWEEFDKDVDIENLEKDVERHQQVNLVEKKFLMENMK